MCRASMRNHGLSAEAEEPHAEERGESHALSRGVAATLPPGVVHQPSSESSPRPPTGLASGSTSKRRFCREPM